MAETGSPSSVEMGECGWLSSHCVNSQHRTGPDPNAQRRFPGVVLEDDSRACLTPSPSWRASCPPGHRCCQVEIGLPGWPSGKNSACQCRNSRRCGFNPWVRKIPWRRKWQLSLIIYGFIKALLCTCCFVTPSGSRDTPRGDGEEVGCRKEKKFSQGCCMGLSTFLLSW